MLGILVGIFLLLLWILFLYFLKGRLTIILIGVGIGALGVFWLAGLIEFNWSKITGISLTEEQSKTLIAPIVEEFAKLLFILFVLWYTRHKDISFDTMLFGASVGLGFAFIENFGVIENPLNVLLRGVFSWPMHILTATLLSYGIERFIKSKSKRNTFWTLALLLIAVGIHSAFNYTVLCLGFH